MLISFEELWNKSEEFQKNASKDTTTQNIIEELLLKLNLYKAIDLKTEIPEEERQKIKSRTLGEILLTFTCLSLKDNINVYEALSVALQYRSSI
jgi:hypothetical protein